MSLLAPAFEAVITALPVATAAVPYTPDLFLVDAAAGALVVLAWIGAAAAAGVGIFFAMIGIRKGFGFLKTIIQKA